MVTMNDIMTPKMMMLVAFISQLKCKYTRLALSQTGSARGLGFCNCGVGVGSEGLRRSTPDGP